MEIEANRPRLLALTSLRFFAALHVVIFHLYTMHVTSGPMWYRKLSSIGYVGVGLFFVLSGFILVYTYAGRSWTVASFWRARFARIYPAYLFCLLVTAPSFFYAVVVLNDTNLPSFAWFRSHVLLSWILPPLLLQSWVPQAALAWNSPAWSLSDEVFFYAIFPLLAGWLMPRSRRTLMALVLFAWAFSLALSSGYAIFKPDGVLHVDDQASQLFWLDALKFHPLARLPEFLVGACLGFLFLRGSIDRKWATPLALIGLTTSVIVVALSPYIPYTVLHNSMLTPAFGAIIYGLALRPNWIKVLEIKPLQLLGEASYSLYLLHSLIIGVYFNPFQAMHNGGFVHVVIGVAIMAGISIFAYLFIERPPRRWLRPKQRQLPITSEATKAW